MNVPAGTSWSTTALALGLDVAAKATIILLLGLIAQIAAGRRRAAIGSTVGNACVLGLLLLLPSALVLPRMSLAWLPSASNATTSRPEVPSTRPVDTVMPFAMADPLPDLTPVAATVGERAHPAASRPVPPRPAPRSSEPAAASSPSRPTDWLALGLAGYAIVAAALLARLLASLAAVGRLGRSGTPVEDPVWLEALGRCRRRLGIGRAVGLSWSPSLGVPIVLGWIRPTILLPAALSSLEPGEHAESILLHELSHVRRGDYPWNVLLHVVRALYWPHPLVWLLGHAIAELRERICDDLCIHELGDASTYGATLLAVAGGLSHRPGPALGIAMARSPRLLRRLKRISRSPGDARCLPPPMARAIIATMAVAASATLGAIQLTRAEVVPPEKPAFPVEAHGGAPQAPAPDHRAGRVFHLQVAADTGRPVPNADVRVWSTLRDEWRKADAEGRLDITYATGPADRHFGVAVWGEGRAMQQHNWGLDPHKPIPDGEVVRLQPGEALGGIVQDEQGRPIAGVEVYLWSHNYKRKDPHELLHNLRAITGPDGRWRTSGAPESTGELLGFRVIHPDYLSSRDYTDKEIIPKIADLRAGKAVTVMKKGVPIEGRVVDEHGRPVAGAMVLSAAHRGDVFSALKRFAVTTDARGHFRTGQVREGEWFLLARARGHAPGEKSVKIGKAVPQVEIGLGPPLPFFGRVVDPDGKPIEGAFVNVDMWRTHRFLGVYLYSDADGRFRWDDGPGDELMVNVDRTGYAGVFMHRVTPTDQGVIFTLKPSLTVRGTVRDAETGKRIEQARIEYGAIDPKTGEVAKWTGMPSVGSGVQVFQGDLDANFPVEADAYRIRLTADGYAPFVSRAFRRDETVVNDYDIKLVPGRPSGALATVLRPDGKPLAGARVYSTQLNENLSVSDGVVNSRHGGRDLLTAPDGTFPLPTYDKPFVVLILGDDMFAYASQIALKDSPRIQARPFGRVEGRFFVGARAISDQRLELSGLIQDDSTLFCILFFGQSTTTDAEGRFVFEKVVPIPHLRVAPRTRSATNGAFFSAGEAVHVRPGETTRATIGGRGRPVIGRVEPPEGWMQAVDFTDRGAASLESNRPVIPYPLELFRGKTTLGNDSFAWDQRWRKTPEGIAYQDSLVTVTVDLAPDGSFRFDDMPAGDYRVTVRLNEDAQGRDRGPFARTSREFTIPDMPGGRSNEPIDLGSIRMQIRTVPGAGEPAPEFEVKTVDGKTLTLKDYRGMYLLLDFGVMWDVQSRFQIARLNDVHKRFGGDRRFAILSLVMAPDDAWTRAFIAGKGEPWPQAIIGRMSNRLASAFGAEPGPLGLDMPAAILIGPDGKIIARDLWYNNIGEAIGQALGRPAK